MNLKDSGVWFASWTFLLVTGVVDGGNHHRVKRVVGGKRTEPHKYPWQVYIEVTNRDGSKSVCGGSIISGRHVLSAAHCFIDDCGQIARKVRVHAGAYDVCEDDWIATRTIRSRQITFHPGYDPRNEVNDVAVLTLKKNFTFSHKVKSIDLPPEEAIRDCKSEEYDKDFIKLARTACEYYDDDDDDEDYDYEEEEDETDDDYYEEEYDYYEGYDTEEDEEEESEEEIIYDYEYKDNCTTYYDGRWATVIGWGETFKFSGSCILRKANKRVYANHDELCQTEDGYVRDEDQICAYNPNWNSDSCFGDSGGGLVIINKAEPPVLIGVVSYADEDECAYSRAPGFYARVQHFTDWIRMVMQDEYKSYF